MYLLAITLDSTATEPGIGLSTVKCKDQLCR